MTTFTVSDYAYPSKVGDGSLRNTWDFTADDKVLGQIYETEDGYAGRLDAMTPRGNQRTYTCPEVAHRQSVIDRFTEMAPRLNIV